MYLSESEEVILGQLDGLKAILTELAGLTDREYCEILDREYRPVFVAGSRYKTSFIMKAMGEEAFASSKARYIERHTKLTLAEIEKLENKLVIF